MPPKPIGERALTGAERQARNRTKRAMQCEAWRVALAEILASTSHEQAVALAFEALMAPKP
jgi:1,2-phenylacetyl-CoA epoxidase PaaB subunit